MRGVPSASDEVSVDDDEGHNTSVNRQTTFLKSSSAVSSPKMALANTTKPNLSLRIRSR